jgi:hypothetical protein
MLDILFVLPFYFRAERTNTLPAARSPSPRLLVTNGLDSCCFIVPPTSVYDPHQIPLGSFVLHRVSLALCHRPDDHQLWLVTAGGTCLSPLSKFLYLSYALLLLSCAGVRTLAVDCGRPIQPWRSCTCYWLTFFHHVLLHSRCDVE